MDHYTDKPYRQDFRQYIPIEGLVSRQIDRIMENQTAKNTIHYEEAVLALIDLLAPDDEEAALKYREENNIRYQIDDDGKNKHGQLFRYIKRLLYKKKRGMETRNWIRHRTRLIFFFKILK